ncbi:MAG: hypothetical protein CMP91_11720 [Gammaproteobacteria bacterium]|nr:hypothetical protein [Gammaproteobacteria bacterium]MAY02223.1 hypothetical protein [Gammaproteobacteria bacterium]|tara:strand:- start:132 stop:464 length:333 start_codon:yes stop_codon:yes gene_type:complete
MKLFSQEAKVMTAYLIANYKITNPEEYESYVPAVMPTLGAHGAEVLVADYETEVLEGAPSNVSVVLRFPSKEAARSWYNSPEYQAIIHHRTDNTEGFLVFADQFTLPNDN